MKSMTGFGSGEHTCGRGKILVEVRSYNHRFLDIRLRLHKTLQPFEPRVFQWIKDRLERGRVGLALQLEEDRGEGAPLQFNPGTLRFYRELEEMLQNEFKMPGVLDIPTVIQLRELVTAREETTDLEDVWPDVLKALEDSVRKLDEMQKREGDVLRADLIKRIRFLASQLQHIETLAADLPEKYKEKLEERIARLLPLEMVEPQRIAQEIVLFSDKTDVTEERVRLASHLEVCEKALADGSMKGKRLDFLAQEILRELNTIGAKSSHSDIIYRVVDMKTELEKVREQAQNLQ